MSIKRVLAGILSRKLKGQIIVSELGMVKVGLLLLIVIGLILLFLWLSGYLDKVVEVIKAIFSPGKPIIGGE